MEFLAIPGTKSEIQVEIPEMLQQFEAYRQYLESIKTQIPSSAFQFAIAPWHYDHSDHRCPHDSWVESVAITEPAQGERFQNRTVNVSTRRLGAFHDGHISLHYADVHAYLLENPNSRKGHGDWLIDEIRLSENGLVLHEIVSSRASRWLIEASNITYEWQPTVA